MKSKVNPDAETSKLIQMVQDHSFIWDLRVVDCFNQDKVRGSYLGIAGQMGNGMTGELLAFAGLSFLMFENCAHMDGADFNLCSNSRLAGNGQISSCPSPCQGPSKCRTAGETIGFWIF